MPESSQKFMARNRASRVQIEYEVERYGAEQRVQLPFVMGVLADLSGQPAASPVAAPVALAERKFLEFDVDNFDQRMKAIQPRLAFEVANALGGEGQLRVELVFERMEDFSPVSIARQVEALRKLLTARQQLADLITYMDGKTGAEELIAQVLNDPAWLESLAAGPALPPPDGNTEGQA
jgi:type VI secretion system protein ImpB